MSLSACHFSASIDYNLNHKTQVEQQTLTQDQELMIYECQEMNEKYQFWQQEFKVLSSASDPIYEEHHKSMREHGTMLGQHLRSLQDQLKLLNQQRLLIIKHRRGRISDNDFKEAWQVILQKQKKVAKEHQYLKEVHQIIEDAHQVIIKQAKQKLS